MSSSSGVGSGAVSRLPKTKRAGPENRRLTAREGKTLRREAWDPTVDRGANVLTWGEVRERWLRYTAEADATSLVFEEVASGKRAYARRTHRWSPDYQEQQYARLKDMERGIERFYNRPWTGLLSLTASSESVPNPADHLDELRASWEAVRRSLHRELDGRKWDYWWVLEPHESGYAHLHVAVIAEGRLTEAVLTPAVEAHLRRCSPAGREAHQEAVSIRPPGGVENVAAYLNSYLGGYGERPHEMAENEQRFAALLWATGRRQTGASERLRRFQQRPSPEPDGGWVFTAVLDVDGNERPVDPAVPGGVETFETELRWPPPD